MPRFWSADSGLENLIYIALAVVWVIVQIASQNARKRKRDLTTPMSGSPPTMTGTPTAAPEDDLRRFLRELSGESAEPPPTTPEPVRAAAPSVARRVPLVVAPSLPHSVGSAPRTRYARAWDRRRAERRPEPAPPPIPVPPVVAWAPLPEKASSRPMAVVELTNSGRTGLTAPVMASVPMAAPRSLGAFSLSSGRASPVLRRSVLPRNRAALGRAVLHQVIIGEPRALAPYR